MGTGSTRPAFEATLTTTEIAAANELTRRWFASRAGLPAVASGLGVWPLLAALANGAIGATRNELLTAAGVASDRAATVPGALLEAAKASSAIRLALGIWAGERVTLDPEWVAELPVEAVDSLTGDAAVDKTALDEWAARSTDGLIDRMPLDFSQRIDLVLASALSVRTTWVTPFRDVSAPVQAGPWSGLGPCRQLRTTLADDLLRVGDDATVLTVPGEDDIDVLLGLGREDLAPQAVMSRLIDAAADPAWGRSALEMAVGEEAVGVRVSEYKSSWPQKGPEIEVGTVRFSVTADLDLSEDAAALGLILASDEDKAQFDRLAAEPTYVSQAKQSAVAVFSATGFEAAAVTALAMTRAAGIPKMNHRHVKVSVDFDRPFAYLARHRPSGLILIGGWVAEPELA